MHNFKSKIFFLGRRTVLPHTPPPWKGEHPLPTSQPLPLAIPAPFPEILDLPLT